jgi:exopolysaccharide biosynthesis predicted pyruvyltransferase EpsI
MNEVGPAMARSATGIAAEARSFVEAMQARIMDSLQPYREPGAYALIDYPDYSNVGDVAIWLGTVKLLALLNGRGPAYTSTLRAFDPVRCGKQVGSGTLYFLGGGNLGNLYPKHHGLRLAAMRAMPGNRIVQLPQSFAWADGDALVGETRDVFVARDVTLFCREAASMASARERLGIEAVLCPDLAFGLGMLPRGTAAVSVQHLLRRDLEATGAADGAIRSDWRDSSAMMAWRRFGRLIEAASLAVDPAASGIGLKARKFVAGRKLDAGLRLLGRGDYLVTDRLHGHILAVLLALPHSVRDNSTGKNRAFWQAWTRSLSFVHFETEAGASG